jgi:hypothetical protein
MTIVIVLLVAAALGTSVYLAIMYSSIPGAVDERLGKLEDVPQDVGKWVTDTESELGKQALAKGKQRETRTLHERGGLFQRETFVRQARTRNPETGEIETVEPEQRAPRRRLKS